MSPEHATLGAVPDAMPPSEGVASRDALLDVADALHRDFAALHAEDPACRCILLIDPSLRDATLDEDFASGIASLRLQPEPIQWRHRKLISGHRPLLLPLDLSKSAASVLLAASLRMAAEDMDPHSLRQGWGQRIGGWLFSSASAVELARHMGTLAVQQLPAGLPVYAGRRRLLRFFDPLVWPVLWEVSRPAQRAALLGPVKQRLWVDPRLALERVIYPAADSAAPQAEADDTQLDALWDAQQWPVLLALDAFNPAAIDRGLDQGILAQRPAALATLTRLLQLGVGDARDLENLAKLTLSRHVAFDRHPRVRALLEQRPAAQYASAALSALTDDDWHGICEDLAGARSFQDSPTIAPPKPAHGDSSSGTGFSS
ncbi:DUF4123 domain-containing protein [Aquabacterium sp. A7-Y]|uniref:DUF4123 domain-containing protein n=1 Tax=Aquabacterium sp. A7-Y TaxID=1349605 RepID=UPI00223E4B64|nr:DUF4123 domain-containing protein [Aquabacterium sp. A7-Y]MCW7536719.1 DUF4123 domain-containing protein [Aquabacterium sp. A7-Y]